jgi:hypothetical protein
LSPCIVVEKLFAELIITNFKGWSLLEKLIASHLVHKCSPPFLSEGSRLCSKEPATSPCPEPDESI